MYGLLVLFIVCALPRGEATHFFRRGAPLRRFHFKMAARPRFDALAPDDGAEGGFSMPGANLTFQDRGFAYAYASGGHLDFPGAWLAHKDMMPYITNIGHRIFWNIESNVMGVAGGVSAHIIPNTFDFFDFAGIHLSYFTEELGWKTSNKEGREEWMSYLEERLGRDIARFKEPGPGAESRLSRQTVALLPFASANWKGEFGQRATRLFLNVTFWSLRRQFAAVVVGACDREDFEFLAEFPAWKRLLLAGGEHCEQNTGTHLIEHAARAMVSGVNDSGGEWRGFEFVYYTEGDIMLNLRQHDRMADFVERHSVVVPHRFNTFPLGSDFSRPLRQLLEAPGLAGAIYGNLESVFEPKSMMPGVNLDTARCCFSGRMREVCTEFWWRCGRGGGDEEFESNIFHRLDAVSPLHGGMPFHLGSQGGPEMCEVCHPGEPCRCGG